MSLLIRNTKSISFKHILQTCHNLNFLQFKSLRLNRLYCTTEALTTPSPDGSEKVYSPKIKQIVEQISKLTLIEAADLNDCLKKTFNIKDLPMAVGAMPLAAAPAAEDAEPQATKTSFTVKLMKYEETKKVAVIKEIKSIIEGLNLVQAKKFVEGVPQVIKGDIGKDEAEKLKQALEAVGGVCEIS